MYRQLRAEFDLGFLHFPLYLTKKSNNCLGMGRTSNSKEQLIQAMIDLIWQRSYGSLTIDVICEAAEVKKGSFYYFFKSKLELALAAMDRLWEELKPQLDDIYSPSRPPLERIALQMQTAYEKHQKLASEHGCVLGCPYFNLGAEISTIEPELAERVNEILSRYLCYFESSIRDALADGSVSGIEAKETARILFNLFEGMLTQARIKNDVTILADLKTAAARLLRIEALPEVEVAQTIAST